jgi:nitroreductase
MSNPVFDAVRTMVAVRDYTDRPVPDEVVTRIMESAHLSASSTNGQPWHFVVVRDRAKLQQLAGLARSGPYISGAPLAVVVGIEKASPYGLSDASRAIQSMMLTAWADGVGSNWVGFAGMSGVAKLLGIPDEYDVVAIVPFGYPRRPARHGRKNRKPLGEIASAETFGDPFPPD